jgi:hypothetical protein
LGGEDQPADPLIASAEGVAKTPAYRGLAYAVFENLQLADYGNRIPSLSFEVEADQEPISVARIAEVLSDGAILAGPEPGPCRLRGRRGQRPRRHRGACRLRAALADRAGASGCC